jgi:D-aminopeptidase
MENYPNWRTLLFMTFFFFPAALVATAQAPIPPARPDSTSHPRARDLGLHIGVLSPGPYDAITDVPSVKVGHTTLIRGDSIRTGVTAILPYDGNIFQQKVPAAVFVGNGFGKLAGTTQVQELGNLETPIVLTNTLSVGTAIEAVVQYTLREKGNETVQSVNAVVGETNDGWLNDIRGMHVTGEDVWSAIAGAHSGPVPEGNVGAGTGTICFGFKGGIGTASRKVAAADGGYTVGVIVQTNFGGVLEIDGVPIDKELGRTAFTDKRRNAADGSCMIVVATDAPLDSRNLARLAKRAFMGLAKTGGIASNGSGDYVIAFSTDTSCRIPQQSTQSVLLRPDLRNDNVTPLFMAAIEATEEAIVNSLLAAGTMKGRDDHLIQALPLDDLRRILKKYNRIQ